MRKTATALATTALAITLVGSISTAGAQVVDDAEPTSCDGGVLESIVCEASELLAPVEEVVEPVTEAAEPVAEVVAPVAPALSEAEGAGVVPAPAPAPAASPDSAPAPSSSSSSSPQPGASSAPVASTSASAPTGFGSPVTLDARSARSTGSSSRVPTVPVGSSLNLGTLALPVFDLTAPAPSKAAERSVNDVVLPAAAAAAAADALPDGAHPLAVLGAISALLVAAGLLLDHHRKTRHVIPA